MPKETILSDQISPSATMFINIFVPKLRPPTAAETARNFGLSEEKAAAAFRRLHKYHFFFLDPGTVCIRMANPFSAVATKFYVHVSSKHYAANCAWDMLGIPAAMQEDAQIEAEFELTKEPARLAVENGLLIHQGGLVHFPFPVRKWYDDLILT